MTADLTGVLPLSSTAIAMIGPNSESASTRWPTSAQPSTSGPISTPSTISNTTVGTANQRCRRSASSGAATAQAGMSTSAIASTLSADIS
ncbi:hypothetical protein ASE03_21490 [Kitasatospora sp. Root187]|nr:hypothetical protein ASC99_26830 [Kitasatospora sp. Root107]KRB73759.1 hypothetical protein ASE03_21490 [Kitasatospora sp. Root187]